VPAALTDQRIEAVMADPKRKQRLELVDSREPGLRLRIGESTAKWSVLARGAAAARLRVPIGAWPTVGVEHARTMARALKRTFAEAPETEADDSLGTLLDRYKLRRLVQLRKGAVIGRALESVLGPLRGRACAEVSRREIAEAIDQMAERAPIHANRCLAYAKAFFGWAVGRGYLEHNVAAGIAKPTRERARERTPSLDEIAQIWLAADALGYPFGPIVKLLILTATRREEVGGVRVAELALGAEQRGGCWTIPADRSKNGRAIRVPLAHLAGQVLADALRLRAADGPYLFSTTGTSPVSGWSKAKVRLDLKLASWRSEAGEPPLEPWRFHDLRRSFATHACDVLHVDPAVADRCLNHVGASTTSTVARVYARNELYDQRRDALERWADLVGAAVAQQMARHQRDRK
jgi:integrase